MAKRPCLTCGIPTTGTRCPAHERERDRTRGTRTERGYGTEWQRHSETTRRAWINAHGWTCPGFQREPHGSTDLVVDHDIGVLCRTCNGAKAGGFDKRRKRGDPEP